MFKKLIFMLLSRNKSEEKKVIQPEKTEEQKKEDLRILKEEARQYLREHGYKGKVTIISSNDSEKQNKQFINDKKQSHLKVNGNKSSRSQNFNDPIKQMNDIMYQNDSDNPQQSNGNNCD